MDDDTIRISVTRLSRPHSVGGAVIERARSSLRGPTPRRSWRGSPPMAGNPRLRRPLSPGRACRAHASMAAAEWALRRRGDTCCLLVYCPERSRRAGRSRRNRRGSDSNQAHNDDHSSALGSASCSRPRRHIDRPAHLRRHGDRDDQLPAPGPGRSCRQSTGWPCSWQGTWWRSCGAGRSGRPLGRSRSRRR